MNGRLSAAARASHYGTQFWRAQKKVYPTREAMLKAHSKKSIDRRLVLPLDAHNWVRALEVLDARYARLGRTPEHYKMVIRNMVESVVPGSTHSDTALSTTASEPTHSRRSRELAGALDGIRDRAYAEEIPVNSSLWVTLLWAYCALDQPRSALETFAEAKRRFTFSFATFVHMTEMLLPVLCSHGMLLEAQAVRQEYLQKSKRDKRQSETEQRAEGKAAKPERYGGGHQSLLDDRTAQKWMAEAAARTGDWKAAYALLEEMEGNGAPESGSRTVNSLFHEEKPPSPALEAAVPSHGIALNSHDTSRGRLSRTALRELFRSLATSDAADSAVSPEGRYVTERMLSCWRELYGDPAEPAAAHPPPPASDVQCLMNGLAAAGLWQDVLNAFAAYYLGKPDGAAPYLTEVSEKELGDSNECSDGGKQNPLPLDEIALNIVFSSFPRCEVEFTAESGENGESPLADAQLAAATQRNRLKPTPSLALVHLQAPSVVLRLLDDLLLHREDMILTDHVMDAVGPALFQLGQYDRCLHLMLHCPCFTATAAADKRNGAGRRMHTPVTHAEKEIQRRLVALIYAIHAGTNVKMKYAAVLAFPFLFPPEMLKTLPAPDEMPAYVRREVERVEKENAERKKSDEERYEQAIRSRAPTSVRPSRQHYLPATPTSELTEQQESAMQRNFVNLRNSRERVFTGSDADADPRPIPKGLHDTASGWNFYGRGGEMVFSNNKRIPHPFSMHPKVMRSLANPFRGWNPRQNSSLAHKESVLKWNGSSSV